MMDGDARVMLRRLSSEWNVPLSAGLEISDRCNEVCVHCYQEQGRKGEMTTEELFRVLDELAAMGVLLLTLSGGEATLRKDFLQIVEYARSKGFAVRLFTNGLTMTRELAQSLGKLAVQMVEISVYSTQAETHDFVTGVRGSFEKTIAGVRNLVEAGVGVTIKSPVMNVNEHELADYAAFARALGVEYSVSPSEIMAREGGDRTPEAFEMSDRGRVSALRDLLTPWPDACGVQPERPLDSAPCGAGSGLHIEPNGELQPCTMLEFDLGHALRDGIGNAHSTNERAVALRQLTWANLHGCRDCALRLFCEHCYSSALTQSGDALGPYPSGCRGAKLKYEARMGRALEIVARPDGSTSLGPYQERSDGAFQAVDDVVTEADDALAARLGWTRRSSAALPAVGIVVRPGDLVQIRRPGRKQSKLERIPDRPDAQALAAAAEVRTGPTQDRVAR